MRGLTDTAYVLKKLDWMREERIWPNGLRYLWTDAFGLVLLVSLYDVSREERYLDQAEWLVAEVNRVLGRPRGIRIGEEPCRDGQYFHYLAMWLYALAVLGRHRPGYRDEGVALVRQIHDAFVLPGRGVIWKMQEDLSGPYPGYGLGALDAFDGYVSYRLLDERIGARDCRDALAHRADGPGSRHYSGSRPRHDALANPLFPRRGLGGAAQGALASDAGPHVARGRGILRASRICRMPASLSPITVSRSGYKPSALGQNASMRSTLTSRPTALATSTTATPSPM